MKVAVSFWAGLALLSACTPLTGTLPDARSSQTATSSSTPQTGKQPAVSPTVTGAAAPLPSASAPVQPAAQASVNPSARPDVKVSASPSSSPSVKPTVNPTPTPVLTPVPSPSTPASPSVVSPFDPLNTQDLDALSNYGDDGSDSGQTLALSDEQAISSDLLKGGDLPTLLSLGLTTDGGPLLYTSDNEFTVQALMPAPRAWKRSDIQAQGRRIAVRRRVSGNIELLSVQERTGNFVIDLDGSLQAPSPGSKPIRDLQVRRILLEKRSNGKWAYIGFSPLLNLPARPDAANLPKIKRVIVSQASGTVLTQESPLKITKMDQLASLQAGKLTRVEADVTSADTAHTPPVFLYLHVGDKRVLFRDTGKLGDLTAGDGRYTAIFTTPAVSVDPLLTVAVDALSAATLADETTPNYQAVTWFLPFRLTN